VSFVFAPEAEVRWWHWHGTDLGWWHLVGNRKSEGKAMRYFVLVERGQSKAEIFADVLTSGKAKPAAVYVVGVEDGLALGLALQHGKLEADEMDAKQRMAFTFCEAIGTEDGEQTIASLIGFAEHRIEEIRRNGTHRRSV
jgi:hypothetical protein